MKEENLPDFFQGIPATHLGLVSKPFHSSGGHKTCVSIISIFLDENPKEKVDVMIRSGMLKKSPSEVKIGSYGSKYFSTLQRLKALRYDSLTFKWVRGDNFFSYLTYIIDRMIQSKAKDKFFSLLSPEQMVRVLDGDLDKVVRELVEDSTKRSCLRRIWRGTEDTVKDFILNSDD